MRVLSVTLALLTFVLLMAQAPPPKNISVELEVGAQKEPDVMNTDTKPGAPPGIATLEGKVVKGLVKGNTTIALGDTSIQVKVTAIAPVVTLKALTEKTPDIQVAAETAPIRVVTGDKYKLIVQGHESDGKLREVTSTPLPPSDTTILQITGTEVAFPNASTGAVDAEPASAWLRFTLTDDTTHTLQFQVVERPKSLRVDTTIERRRICMGR